MVDAGLKERAERVALQLFDGGATVPFVARYRKDHTGSLDEVALRLVGAESEKLRALDERKAQVISSLEERKLLTPELRAALEQAPTRALLDDLYAPYKVAKKTRASQAIERGLLPLAVSLLDPGEMRAPEALAAPFVSKEKGVESVAQALE